jgi:SAM-dependent methyltransferase
MPKCPLFPKSAIAQRLLGHLKGIEIAGSAQNDFELDSINVDYTNANDTAFKIQEASLCDGCMKPVDVVAEGDSLPFSDQSFDFLLSSHVFEHMPNSIGALTEWHRVVKGGGLLYLVIPHEDTAECDVRRGVTPLAHHLEDYEAYYTPETHPYDYDVGYRGHFHVWNLTAFLEFLKLYFSDFLAVVETHANDDRCGNGFVVVLRVNHIEIDGLTLQAVWPQKQVPVIPVSPRD